MQAIVERPTRTRRRPLLGCAHCRRLIVLGERVGGIRCFYRIMGEFGLVKEDYKGFKDVQARWRKLGRDGWAPDTLEDSLRNPLYYGYGRILKRDYLLDALRRAPEVGVWQDPRLTSYIEVWFEADAMHGQFEIYVAQPYRISLRPFRGDYTIGPKWKAAKDIEAISHAGKEVTIVYFGDLDAKGAMIPRSAVRDIQQWCDAPFRFVMGGLTAEQARRFRLPENPERPGQWQWEALDDEQAHEIITEALARVVDLPLLRRVVEEADASREKWLKDAARKLGLPWNGHREE